MTLQTINLGTYANDGTGDDLRTAFTKVNANFALIQTETGVTNGANVGTGVGVFNALNSGVLDFKSLTSTGNSIAITSTDTTVNLESNTKIVSDTSPELGGALNLNNNYIYGGDVQSTVYGYDQRISDNLLSLLIDTNSLNVDMGSFTQPSGYETNPARIGQTSGGYSWDFGSSFSSPNNEINFGYFTTDNLLQNSLDNLISLTGNFNTLGGYSLSFNLTGNTSLTLPNSGTLLNNNYTSPTFSGTISATNISAGGYLYVTGNFSVNNTMFEVDASTGNVTFQDGTIQNTAWPSTSGTKASNATGTAGQISWDANYIYICTATNTWKRAPLTGGY
jgi:hypothetical protein